MDLPQRSGIAWSGRLPVAERYTPEDWLGSIHFMSPFRAGKRRPSWTAECSTEG